MWFQFAFTATALCPFAHLTPVTSCILSGSPGRDMPVGLFKGGQTHAQKKDTVTDKVNSKTRAGMWRGCLNLYRAAIRHANTVWSFNHIYPQMKLQLFRLCEIFYPMSLLLKNGKGSPKCYYPYSASPATKVYLEFAVVKNSVSFCRCCTFSLVAKELFASRVLNREQIIGLSYQSVRNLWDHLNCLCPAIVSATPPTAAPYSKDLTAKSFICIF